MFRRFRLSFCFCRLSFCCTERSRETILSMSLSDKFDCPITRNERGARVVASLLRRAVASKLSLLKSPRHRKQHTGVRFDGALHDNANNPNGVVTRFPEVQRMRSLLSPIKYRNCKLGADLSNRAGFSFLSYPMTTLSTSSIPLRTVAWGFSRTASLGQ